jgi:hypothetical protein
MSKRRSQVTIPEPYENVSSVYHAVTAMKELVEALAGQRGGPQDVAITWGDLLELGLIKPEQVPEDLGQYRP